VYFENGYMSLLLQGKIAVVNSTDFIKLIMTHKLMKKHDMDAIAAAKAARIQVAAVTLSNLALSERFVNVPAQPPTASLSAPGDGPILAPSVEAPGDGQILAPWVEARGDGPILAPSLQAPGDGQILAPLVQAAPSSSLVLSPGCFAVTCKNASMYGKKMRDVHIAGFSVQSDAVIRFRSSDDKVAVGDLLVGVGTYGKLGHAQEALYKLIEKSDDKISDLDSLELDKEIDQKVCTLFKTIQIVGTKFQIVATIWNFWY